MLLSCHILVFVGPSVAELANSLENKNIGYSCFYFLESDYVNLGSRICMNIT